MWGHFVVQGLFLLGGIISVLAAAFNWNWYFNTRNAQQIVRNVGRNRARLFYAVLGLILIGMAVFFYFETASQLKVN